MTEKNKIKWKNRITKWCIPYMVTFYAAVAMCIVYCITYSTESYMCMLLLLVTTIVLKTMYTETELHKSCREKIYKINTR